MNLLAETPDISEPAGLENSLDQEAAAIPPDVAAVRIAIVTVPPAVNIWFQYNLEKLLALI